MVVSIFVSIIFLGQLAYVLKQILLIGNDDFEVEIVYLLMRSSVTILSPFNNVLISIKPYLRVSLFNVKLAGVKPYILK